MKERESILMTWDHVKPFIESLGCNYTVVDTTDEKIVIEPASQLNPTVIIRKIDDLDKWCVSFLPF